jgi:hypothetical protein
MLMRSRGTCAHVTIDSVIAVPTQPCGAALMPVEEPFRGISIALGPQQEVDRLAEAVARLVLGI